MEESINTIYKNTKILMNIFISKCKQSKLEINTSKYERIIRENINMYDMIKGLEELDLEYTKYVSIKSLKTIRMLFNTYKDLIDEELKHDLKEYELILIESSLHYFQYKEIQDKIEHIHLCLKYNCIHKGIGDVVYEKKNNSYGTILDESDKNGMCDIYSFKTNTINQGINKRDLLSQSLNKRKGIINGINEDGSYNITYEDGGYDFNVKENNIEMAKDQKTNLKKESSKQYFLFGKTVIIGDYYKLKFDNRECDVQIVRVEDKISVNYNNQYIFNDIDKLDLKKSEYNPLFKTKYKIMDIVEVDETKDIISLPCNVIYSNAKQNGYIIGYNEKLNIPIIEIEYIKRMDIKDVLYENQYQKGDEVLYGENIDGKYKWNKGVISEVNNSSLSVSSDYSSDKVVSYSNIHPYLNKSYSIFTKVNIHFNENCILPGIVLSYSRNNTYDILLLNKYFLNNIPEYMISMSKLKKNDEVMLILDGKLITIGNITSINENRTYSITDNKQCYENILHDNLLLCKDNNYRIGMTVSANYKKNLYKGKINEIRYKLNDQSQYELYYGVLYDDNDYKYVNEDNIHPYNDSNTLFVVGDRIIDIKGEKGIITKVQEEDKYYSILCDDKRYEENVLLERIRRDSLRMTNKYNIGDVVIKDRTTYKVIFVHYNNNLYDIEIYSKYPSVSYKVKEEELSPKTIINHKYEINDRIKYQNQNGFIHSITGDKTYIIYIENGDKFYYAKDIREYFLKKLEEEEEKKAEDSKEEMIEYYIGEEVEVYLMYDRKEQWVKATINDYDNLKNEFSLKVGSVIRYGIKPENVRKCKDEKRRIINHEDYIPTISRFYVDEELRIDEPCLVLSCDEYNNGVKKYKIKYQFTTKIVDESKLQDCFLPLQ